MAIVCAEWQYCCMRRATAVLVVGDVGSASVGIGFFVAVRADAA